MSDEKDKNDSDITQQLKEIEIRSVEVQEIMGFIPHWIIRWGITVIFLVIFFILVGSWFFRYPDIISSTIVVTTENPPANIVARATGKIDELFVQDNQEVKEGDFIAIIESATNHRHLFALKEKLESLSSFFNHFDTPPPGLLEFDKNYSLGSLQSTYAVFLKSYADYRHFIKLNSYRRKIDSLHAQIARRNLLHMQLELQKKILGEELNLSSQQYERAKTLHKDGIISKSDLDAAKSTFLQKKYSDEGAKSNLTNSSLQISQLEQSVLDLELQYKEERKGLELALSQAYENLTGQIAQWEQNYLLRAPISGVVTFTKYWSVNQNVDAGSKVVTVIPKKGGKIIGKVVLPIRGSGKVKIGQKVNIKFTSYPHQEYGIVRGVIKSKSLVASDNYYTMEVGLPNGLLTSYNKELDFNQEMQGIAEIITEDIRLLERIFKPIKAILKKN